MAVHFETFCFPFCCNLWPQPSQLCYRVVSSLYRTVIFLQGSYTEIKLLLTRLTVVDGLMWRTKISSHTYSKTDLHYRMQVSD